MQSLGVVLGTLLSHLANFIDVLRGDVSIKEWAERGKQAALDLVKTLDNIWSIRKEKPITTLGDTEQGEGTSAVEAISKNLDEVVGEIEGVWEDHYEAFAGFLKEYSPKHVLEIGGAHGLIAKKYLSKAPEANWTIVEPNPSTDDVRVKIIKGWFNKDFSYKEKVDAVVHSHVLEHTYNPKEYLEAIGEFLKLGDMQIFSFPNMIEQLTRKYTNCLNFEHTAFITEYFADSLLKLTGFEIVGKKYFRDHSIFYAAKKVIAHQDLEIENKYEEYKKLFNNFISYHENMIRELNQKILNSDSPIYLFGAHIFSQYLIGFGLLEDKIVGVLDNGPAKQGMRLYGTKFIVESPQILKNKGPVNIILKAGIYNDEIKKDIIENINPEAVFW